MDGFWEVGFWEADFWALNFWQEPTAPVNFWADGFWADGFWADGFWYEHAGDPGTATISLLYYGIVPVATGYTATAEVING